MWKWILVWISIPFIVGCGGGDSSSEKATSKDENVLVLKVNRVSIGAFSNIPRMRYEIDSDMVSIANISVNKEAEILLSGADSEIFELKSSGGRESQLSLIKRDTLLPDKNKDGVYELNIIATDRNNQTATCKIAYKINVPKAESKDILDGNHFYKVDAKGIVNDGYTMLEFTEKGALLQKFIKDSLVNESVEDIFYLEDKIIFTKNGKNTLCLVDKKTNSISLSCKENELFKEEVIWWKELDEAKNNPSLSNSNRTVISTTVVKSLKSSAPIISKFALTGTTLVKDNIVQLDKSINGGKYSVTIELSEKLKGSETAYLFFHKASSLDIQRSGSRVLMKRLLASTTLEAKILEDGIHQFSINGQSIILDNSEKFADEKFNGYLNLFICDDIISFRTCHYADIPVVVGSVTLNN